MTTRLPPRRFARCLAWAIALVLPAVLAGAHATDDPAEGASTLTLQFTTGGDDLRGGNVSGSGNNLWIEFHDAHGRRVLQKANVNRSQTWGAHSIHTVTLTHTGPVGRLASVDLTLTDRVRADIFEQPDNWSLEAVRIAARAAGQERLLYDGRVGKTLTAGHPPVRLALRRIVDECVSDAQCDDGLHCNGAERCVVGAGPDALRQCRAGIAIRCASGEFCDESQDRCSVRRIDADGDGRAAFASGGDDCDDQDPDRFPGNVEVCDAHGHDEDCDLGTGGERDLDRDGHTDAMCFNWGPPRR